MSFSNNSVHLFAGAVGGTVGAVITCPLEVVKTRLQSSSSPYQQVLATAKPSSEYFAPALNQQARCETMSHQVRQQTSVRLIHCFRNIIQTEGIRALFKGLGPNLVGVAPSRAVYFYAYATSKQFLSSAMASETTVVHIFSAACAGFSAASVTNPIWFVKTRLQLDKRPGGKLSAWACTYNIYRAHGLRGFYKGITASYYGLSETVVHLVLYEEIKSRLRSMKESSLGEDDEDIQTAWNFVQYMGAGATSKTIASCLCYPHEVARTRMREEGTRYRRFWQTLHVVVRDNGVAGLYRGLAVQLLRQIPNTAIMMATYELVLYVCSTS